MASSMIEILTQQLGQQAMAQIIARRLGVDEATVRKAIQIGLPLIVAALARNTTDKSGADALSSALKKDHDGSLLDNLDGYLKRGGATDTGDAILGHVLGTDRRSIESELGRATGLDADTLAKLLPLLAPLVMAQLGKAQRDQGLDATDLSGLLRKEREALPRTGGPSRGGAAAGNAGAGAAAHDESARIGMDILTQILGSRD